MKVFFNTLPSPSYLGVNNINNKEKRTISIADDIVQNNAQMAGYYPIFRAKPDSTMLLSQSGKLLCAYSRKPMLSPYTFRSIVSKLGKKTNAQSAINFLQAYRDYMPDVESAVFDMFEQFGVNGKKDFQDILSEKRPEALARLRQKQTDVLHSTDGYISQYDENFAEEMFFIRDTALLKVNDGTFSRSEVLENLNLASKNFPKSKDLIHNVYKMWYRLPRSFMDYDAFIVKYSKFSHNDIAQRLLSMAVASVEHIKPYAEGGEDILWNYVLTRMLYNQDKGDMNLAEYNDLNPDIGIKTNLPKYIDDICREIKSGNDYFLGHVLYPKKLRQNIVLETNWEHLPEIEPPQFSSRDRQIPNSKKGANRYRQNRK